MRSTGLDDYERGATDGDGVDPLSDQHDDDWSTDAYSYADGDAPVAEGSDGEEVDAGDEDIPAGRSAARNALEWLVVIAGAVLLAVVVNTMLLQAFYIPSPSMEPTLVNNDRILVNKIGNRFSDPERGQIVVFHRPDGASGGPDAPSELVKRVIGLPGETVGFADGRVLIDGDFLDEPYLPEGSFTQPQRQNAPDVILEEDEYFMMGDNRGNSLDSRVWGPLDRDDVVGRAFVKFWPISDFELF